MCRESPHLACTLPSALGNQSNFSMLPYLPHKVTIATTLLPFFNQFKIFAFMFLRVYASNINWQSSSELPVPHSARHNDYTACAVAMVQLQEATSQEYTHQQQPAGQGLNTRIHFSLSWRQCELRGMEIAIRPFSEASEHSSGWTYHVLALEGVMNQKKNQRSQYISFALLRF